MAVAVVVLAAGTGKRMKSNLPKVLHKVGGAPLIWHILQVAKSIGPERTVIVCGNELDMVRRQLDGFGIRSRYAVQNQRLGTAHATAAARGALEGFEGKVVVVYGDTPFIRPATLASLAGFDGTLADVTVLGFEADDPGAYGRLVLDNGGGLERIVEFKDASPSERKIAFCNSGAVSADAGTLFELVDAVRTDNAAGEFYLTDIVGIAKSKGLSCAALKCAQSETIGVNDRSDLAAAEAAFQHTARNAALHAGATLIAPDTVRFSFDTDIEPDVEIEPYVQFGPGVTVRSGARILPFSYLEGCVVGKDAVIGPYARIRPGSRIGSGARIGNFVEVKAASIGASSKASHLTYIGDAEIGERVNIGAGTVICNYDGKTKHATSIGDGAFIGSDSILVAPVKVGDSAMTAAGSVITSDVPPDALAISRPTQSILKGFARRFFGREKEKKLGSN